MLMVRRIIKWVSILLISGSALFLLRTLAWSNRLDGDSTFSYECCTQEAGASFHAHYWSMFFLTVKFGVIGCAGLAMSLSSQTTRKVGIWTLGVATGLLPFSFLMVHSGWFGAAAGTLIGVVFCAGLEILAIGIVRLAWEKYRRPINRSLV